MFRISKLADYAIIILQALATNPDLLQSAREIAKHTYLAAPTVSKILKILAEANLIISVRGAGGGYRLARSTDRITIVQVISAIEGMPALTECSQHINACLHDSVCTVKHNWQIINQVILNVLENLTLANMAQPLTLGSADNKQFTRSQVLLGNNDARRT